MFLLIYILWLVSGMQYTKALAFASNACITFSEHIKTKTYYYIDNYIGINLVKILWHFDNYVVNMEGGESVSISLMDYGKWLSFMERKTKSN